MTQQRTRTMIFMALAAVLGIAAYAAPMMLVMKAYGQEYDLSDDLEVVDAPVHSWVFISNCDEYAYLNQTMPLQTSYVAYLGSYDIVCYPSAKDPTQAQSYVNLMRTVFPHDKMVFVFDTRNPTTAYDFKLGMSMAGVPASHDSALGVAFIPQGWAMSVYNAQVVDHELAHLVTGKDHKSDADLDDPGVWS